MNPTDNAQKKSEKEKGCRCGRTKCLKQYCACFRNDVRCTNDCVCVDCHNDGKHEQARMMAVRLVRLNDPMAFKGTSLELENQEVHTPNGTLKTVRGCRCRRSKCQKKYCECFGAGLKCSTNCVCEGCLNGNDPSKPFYPSGGSASSVARMAPAIPAGFSVSNMAGKTHFDRTSKASLDTSRASRPPQLSFSRTSAPSAEQKAEKSQSLASRRPPISVEVRNPTSMRVACAVTEIPLHDSRSRAPVAQEVKLEDKVEVNKENKPLSSLDNPAADLVLERESSSLNYYMSSTPQLNLTPTWGVSGNLQSANGVDFDGGRPVFSDSPKLATTPGGTKQGFPLSSPNSARFKDFFAAGNDNTAFLEGASIFTPKSPQTSIFSGKSSWSNGVFHRATPPCTPKFEFDNFSWLSPSAASVGNAILPSDVAYLAGDSTFRS
ncbi:hypothetical protein GUITHDRAFT_152657 [Guillardia theta CCMP2712]|uniref:CRC domain-containing protein n=1 Tax=Guillardia theta (strain CCMP2712) TaxID=905079 RepID=L1JAU1_GUITC|nr:hypothetical protein GUITHDRAFT_152657 [Guillardia theta CCMP2712]EKX45658.1 hypothetical protein GUITHDRAFT_152657 [Guillardia theta CCMP2712]|mmetsp:Transcript_6250/g.22213  ORF Transcript_6250/g.22213 Transcript_6250/m.22213 type:complete len:435 (-) Transcript_6250:149-1453(-)|eukprot:XP_005832638.1 hypothetical protein GUITHDRAFT_152657 [Guillardia theta CCMP2712]